MEEQDKKSGGAVGCFIIGMVACMLLPAYVLSIGPMFWLAERNPGLEWLQVIYIPIFLLTEYCQPIDDVLMCYLDLWIEL